MTYTEFESQMMEGIEQFSAAGLNKGLSRKAIRYAVRSWNPGAVGISLEVTERSMVRRVKRRLRESMNPFVLLIFMAVIGAIAQWAVKRILDWWLQQPIERNEMLWAWCREFEFLE